MSDCVCACVDVSVTAVGSLVIGCVTDGVCFRHSPGNILICQIVTADTSCFYLSGKLICAYTVGGAVTSSIQERHRKQSTCGDWSDWFPLIDDMAVKYRGREDSKMILGIKGQSVSSEFWSLKTWRMIALCPLLSSLTGNKRQNWSLLLFSFFNRTNSRTLRSHDHDLRSHDYSISKSQVTWLWPEVTWLQHRVAFGHSDSGLADWGGWSICS